MQITQSSPVYKLRQSKVLHAHLPTLPRSELVSYASLPHSLATAAQYLFESTAAWLQCPLSAYLSRVTSHPSAFAHAACSTISSDNIIASLSPKIYNLAAFSLNKLLSFNRRLKTILGFSLLNMRAPIIYEMLNPTCIHIILINRHIGFLRHGGRDIANADVVRL